MHRKVGLDSTRERVEPFELKTYWRLLRIP